jgi:hypothetical protein
MTERELFLAAPELDAAQRSTYLDAQEFNPNGNYLAIGEVVEVEVKVSAYVGKQGPRYSLSRAGGQVEGEF